MDTRLNRISVAVFALLVGGTAGAAVMPRPAPGFRGCPIVTDHTLSRMRGGFSVPFGSGTLDIAFSIQRVTYINGQLKAITKLTIPRIGPDVSAGAAVRTFTAPSVSPPTPPTMPARPTLPPPGTSPSPTTGASASAPAPSPSVPSAAPNPPAGQSAIVPVPSHAVTVSSGGATVTVNGLATAIQNGGGNTAGGLALPNLTQHALTVIQNSLDDQRIQNATVINATVKNLGVYKAINLSSRISQGVAAAVQ